MQQFTSCVTGGDSSTFDLFARLGYRSINECLETVPGPKVFIIAMQGHGVLALAALIILGNSLVAAYPVYWAEEDNQSCGAHPTGPGERGSLGRFNETLCPHVPNSLLIPVQRGTTRRLCRTGERFDQLRAAARMRCCGRHTRHHAQPHPKQPHGCALAPPHGRRVACPHGLLASLFPASRSCRRVEPMTHAAPAHVRRGNSPPHAGPPSFW